MSRLECLIGVITQLCPAARRNHQCSRYHLSEACVHVQLEFNDVFLVDFFKNSPAGAEWRVLLWYIERLNGRSPDGMRLVHVRAYHSIASQRAVQCTSKLAHLVIYNNSYALPLGEWLATM